MWRRPAKSSASVWPSFGDSITVEIGESVDPSSRFMVLAAKVYATGLVIEEERTKLEAEEIWSGHVSFGQHDFSEVDGGSVNVPMASVGAAVVGLRAVLDLRSFVPVKKVTEIVILSDHTVSESALRGQAKFPYLQPIVEVLQNYKNEIIENEFPLVTEIKLTKIDAVNNRAAKLAKQLKNPNNLDSANVSTIGDYELFPAVLKSYKLAEGKKNRTNDEVGHTT